MPQSFSMLYIFTIREYPFKYKISPVPVGLFFFSFGSVSSCWVIMGSDGTVSLLDLSFHFILSQVTGIEAEALSFFCRDGNLELSEVKIAMQNLYSSNQLLRDFPVHM